MGCLRSSAFCAILVTAIQKGCFAVQKKIFFRVLWMILIFICLLCSACAKENNSAEATDETVVLNMNAEYRLSTKLPRGNGQRAKVILLLGQSNASGSSIVSYLEKNSAPADFARYSAGFPSVLINYCIDDHNACSEGEFGKVDLTCGAANGFFGPEVGMADGLSSAYPDETVFILKYTMSGYSLHHHWLSAGQRGSIYHAFLPFVTENMEHLSRLGYDVRIGAICWLQGESDAIYRTPEEVYIERMRKFRDDLVREVGIEAFGIIEVGWFCGTVRWLTDRTHEDALACDATIMRAQERLCSEEAEGDIPGRFVMLTQICKALSLDNTYINPKADGHYNNRAMALIGSDAAYTLARI